MSVTSVRFPADVEARLAEAAQAAQRPKSWIINEAVREYLDHLGDSERRWQETLEALESVKAGQMIEGAQVDEWLASWGTGAVQARP